MTERRLALRRDYGASLCRRLPGVVSTRVGYVKDATHRNRATHAAAMEIASGSTRTSFSDRQEFFFQMFRAPWSAPLGERQAECSRIGLLALPGNQEALQPTRHEAEQQGRLVADHLDRMRHTAGKSRVGAWPHLDTGIADLRD